MYVIVPINHPEQPGVSYGPLHAFVPDVPFIQPQVGGGKYGGNDGGKYGGKYGGNDGGIGNEGGNEGGKKGGNEGGGTAGVTELDAADETDFIPLLSVCTVNVYEVPLTKPVTVIGLVKLLA